MFYKISQRVGVEYIADEIGKVPQFAPIISEPYDIKYFRLIDSCYNYMSPYMSMINEAKRVKTVCDNLFGKQLFDIVTIKGDTVKWIDIFKIAIEEFQNQQYNEDHDSYFIIVKKIQELNQTLRKAKVTDSTGVELINDTMKALTAANEYKQSVEERIFAAVKTKKVKIGSDREISWIEKKYLARDMQEETAEDNYDDEAEDSFT